ncbi:MAG: SHOCT domain-containing protein [Synergistales bacterium]|nr:SHOCT domain-containing protein [Synergistales bacterium]
MSLIIITLVLMILLASSTLQANGSSEGWGMGHMMFWPWEGGMFMMMIPMFLLVIGAIFLIIYMLRKVSDMGRTSDFRQEPPLEILKRRYARGEITREEFEEMKRDLS